MTGTRWWWVRHAPVVNHGGRIYGHNDAEADTGDAEAFQALAQALPADPVWVVTPLRRTRQTLAAALAARGVEGVDPLVEPDLMEQNFGSWQGLTHDQVRRQRQAEAHRFWVSPATERPEGGESFTEVVARVGRAMARLSDRYAGRDIVAVAHGGAIRAALSVALGLEPETALRFAVHNLSLTRMTRFAPDDGSAIVWSIESVNAVHR